MSWDWDTLRTFDAVARHGSFEGAAKVLGVSQSTVSRHIARLEEQAGGPLISRTGNERLTPRGQKVLEAMRPMVHGAMAARVALEGRSEVSGKVVVSAVGELVRWRLMECVPALLERHPEVRLEILVSNLAARLAADEADIALRMARPRRGDLVMRKLSTVTYGVFAHPDLVGLEDPPWVGLSGTLASIPEQQAAQRAFGGRPARVLVEDVEALGQAVELGVGVGILARTLAARLEGVREIDAPAGVELTERTFWALVHRTKRDVPRVRAVFDWIVESLSG